MNYIKQLQHENTELRLVVSRGIDMIQETEAYLLSAKFGGVDSDYVHIRTDMLPRLAAIKAELLNGEIK